jgi:hypothetical protein
MTFVIPDRFGMTTLDNDIVALMTKRVYDIAGCNPNVKVHLNGERINIKNFGKVLLVGTQTNPRSTANCT